ncbi:hypothetical protein BASA81_000720 [Batrachochytrium salamandrivorans]|nr:hypothetical protein BASA81_000720 [Batrachochytrium salamandrivorans]
MAAPWLSLSGKLAFVTGAGSGIGAAVAKSLARAGASVAVLDRNEEAARNTATFINTNINASGAGGRATFFQVDVSNLAQVEQAVDKSQEHFSLPLTLSVNCAGITVDKFMSKMTEEDWDRVLDVNLKGTFFVTKATSKAMVAHKQGGSIVNIASIIAKIGNLGQANYSASKGGVVSFSKTASKELAREGIRVNCILPGFINTPMAQAVPDKVKDKIVAQVPLGKFGEAEDIADMATFLCSDRSKYVTGSVIEVTGGFSM